MLRIAARCSVECALKARITLRGRKGGKRVRLRRTAKGVDANRTVVPCAKLSKRQLRRLGGKRLRTQVRVRAANSAGQVVTVKRRARVRR